MSNGGVKTVLGRRESGSQPIAESCQSQPTGSSRVVAHTGRTAQLPGNCLPESWTCTLISSRWRQQQGASKHSWKTSGVPQLPVFSDNTTMVAYMNMNPLSPSVSCSLGPPSEVLLKEHCFPCLPYSWERNFLPDALSRGNRTPTSGRCQPDPRPCS